MLNKLDKRSVDGVVLLCILILGWIDQKTGHEFSFSIFYLVPVALSAWYGVGSPCYLQALLAAMVWDVANILAGETLSHSAIFVWNGVVRAIFFLTTAYLLRQIKRLLNHEQSLSRTDYQTGLLNFRAFQEALEVGHHQALRTCRSWALLYMDLDHFKQVNDTLGHAEGDRVLTEVANTLKKNLRRSDIIARVGGDEFAIFLSETSKSETEQVAGKIVTCLREMSQHNGWPVTASVGALVNLVPGRDDDLVDLSNRVDQAMYRAKAKGRDSHVVVTWSLTDTPQAKDVA